MSIVQTFINRFAKKHGLIAISRNEQFGADPDEYERLWSFSTIDGTYVDDLQGLCDSEVIGYYCSME